MVVVTAMTQAAQRSKQEGAYVVRRPRATDAIGKSLRATFRCEAPDDEFDRLLARIDRLCPR